MIRYLFKIGILGISGIMRFSVYYAMILVCIFTATAYGSGSNSTLPVTGYSTILVNTSIVMPNYQSKYVNFVVYPLSNTSSYTTLELLNQSSFTKYNMSVKLLNNSGYPPFVGEILISPTTYTPSNDYQIQLQAVGGNPSNFTQIVNVTILNSSLYREYIGIQNSINSIINRNSTAVSTVSTIPVTQPTTSIYNNTSSLQTTAYVNTTIATTIASTPSQGGNLLIYAIVLIIIIIAGAAYLFFKNKKRG